MTGLSLVMFSREHTTLPPTHEQIVNGVFIVKTVIGLWKHKMSTCVSSFLSFFLSFFHSFFLSLYTARPSFEYYRQVYFVHSGLQDESLQVTISKLP